MKKRLTTAVSSLIILLSSCSTSLNDYRHTRPQFDLRSYFTGDVRAWGIIQNYSDTMIRRFCVDIVGKWQGSQGQLHELFYYDDGEQQTRNWLLTQLDDGRVEGTAEDVVGVASGQASGSAFNWQYTLTVAVDGSQYDLNVDDWMFQLDDNRIMNRSYLSKLGVRVAEVSIFFDNSPEAEGCQIHTTQA